MKKYKGKRYGRPPKKRSRFLLPAIILLVLALMGILAISSRNSSEVDEPPVLAEAGATDGESAGQERPADPVTGATTTSEKPKFETLEMPTETPSPARVLRVPILMFHHTGEPPADADELRKGLTVSTTDLESQLGYLRQAGYHPVTEAQLFNALFNGAELPPKPVMLTFDDGYIDNFQVAAPILEKYNFPATFYIITDKVGTPEFMTWDQISDLDRRGMDIGSHTATHQDLTVLSAANLSTELSGAADTLKSKLGHPVYWLCYPAGKYDADVLKYASEAGYLLATTTEPGERQSSEAPLAGRKSGG